MIKQKEKLLYCGNPECKRDNPQPAENFYESNQLRCKSCLRIYQKAYQRKRSALLKRVNRQTLELGYPFPQCEHCFLNTHDADKCAVVAEAESIKECEVYTDWKHGGRHPLKEFVEDLSQEIFL